MSSRWRRRRSLRSVEGGHIRYVRVAMGGVGTKPWRSHEAEAALMGKPANAATFSAAAEAALAKAKPRNDNAFKVELAKRCLVARRNSKPQLASSCTWDETEDFHGDGHTSPGASIIGAVVPRIDGPLKTTGTARYAVDHTFPDLAHAVAVQSTIGRGRIRIARCVAPPRKCPACSWSCITAT